jgi:hypothetical protein
MNHVHSWRRPHQLLRAAMCITLLLMVALSTSQARAVGTLQATPINTDIVADTIWSSAGSPYLVTGPIRIASAATLTIQAGVDIMFVAGAGIRIEGGLQVQGTQARQVRMVGDAGATWQGLTAAQPSGNIALQSVSIQNASIGVAIRQQHGASGQQSGRVDVWDSLFASNGIGIDADYTVLVGAPRLSMRNNLLTNNQIGLQLNGLPSGDLKPKFNHNSFVGNGIGVNTINVSGKIVKMQQQWWGGPDGPRTDPTACGSPPAPGANLRDLVCGAMDFAPWSKVPAGRAIVPGGQAIIIESAVGSGVLSDDDLAVTSVLTLTVPAGTFTETVDLLVSAQAIASAPPGRATELAFEVTAVAGGQAIHRFANGQQLQLEIRYTPADLGGADPRKLVLYSLDENIGVWSFAGIRSTADPANQRLIAVLEHLTRMRVTAVDFISIRLPLVLR